MGESAAGQHLGRHLPQRAIDRDVLPTHIPNRGDPSDPQQAAPQEVLLDAVQRASKVLSRVLAAPAIEEYRCGHAGLAGLGIPEGERPFGEAVPFLRGERARRHRTTARRAAPTLFRKRFVAGSDRPAPAARPAPGHDYTSASFRSSHTGMPSPVQMRRSVFRVRLISPRSSAL